MQTNEQRFTEKVAIVTGATSGIGLATSKRLGREGARVVIVARTPKDVQAAAAEVKAAGAPEVLEGICDVAREDQVAATVNNTLQAFGRLDVVVNNAGVMIFKPLEEQTTEDWMKLLSVDLLGAFYFIKQAFLRMNNGGAIVNISSVHAVETTPLVASYAAAKAAMLSLTRSAAIEGKVRRIRVNAVLPGAVDTPMLWQNPNVVSGAEKVEPALVGQPENIAAVIAYLASDDAAFVDGSEMRVDGGRLGRL